MTGDAAAAERSALRRGCVLFISYKRDKYLNVSEAVVVASFFCQPQRDARGSIPVLVRFLVSQYF